MVKGIALIPPQVLLVMLNLPTTCEYGRQQAIVMPSLLQAKHEDTLFFVAAPNTNTRIVNFRILNIHPFNGSACNIDIIEFCIGKIR